MVMLWVFLGSLRSLEVCLVKGKDMYKIIFWNDVKVESMVIEGRKTEVIS